MQKKEGWITAPLPDNEVERLRALRAYGVLDTEPEEAFDRITRLASRLLKTPIALVSLVDENRQWFKSRHGIDATETPRDLAFCAHVILDDKPMVVKNALQDERFRASPLVEAAPYIRFYAGAPLTDSNGHRLGTLCVIDQEIHEEVSEEDLAVLSDLAALVIDELELRVSIRKEQIANRHKTEFLANMSHEIRTPMNAIVSMTNLLLEGNLSATERNYAETVAQSSEALLQIINDILDFSKIEAGKVELENIAFDLQGLCEEVCAMMSVKAAEKRLDLLLRYPYEAPRYVFGDPGRIRQILFNLINNAIKFTEEGHVLLSVLQPIQHKSRLKFHIEVEDTGIGIPADKTHYIFHKFTQADNSTTRKFGGTGLGLSICRELAQMMGGEIGVDSELGKGSTFWCDILLREDTQKELGFSQPSPALLKGLRVLIIDDNATARTILREQLAPYGVSIKKAFTYDEAIALMDAGNVFDVAIIDDAFLDLWGADIGKRLKEKQPNIALFMLTSAPKRGDVKLLGNIGFAAYFPRPIPNEQLRDALALIAQAKRLEKPLPIITQHNLRETKAIEQNRTAQELIPRTACILVVEDNSVNRLVANSMLQRYGLHPQFASDGKEAVECFKMQKFDLIFMDCQMPEMDGYEATHTMRAMEVEQSLKSTPIVALTAHALKGDDEKCFAAGMDDYISKPIRQEDLERVLVKWLKR